MAKLTTEEFIAAIKELSVFVFFFFEKACEVFCKAGEVF